MGNEKYKNRCRDSKCYVREWIAGLDCRGRPARLFRVKSRLANVLSSGHRTKSRSNRRLQSGQAVAKALPSRTPAEVFLFGAVYIPCRARELRQLARDFDRLSKLPNYLALGVFSNPPQASDLKGFSLDNDDIQSLKTCKPANCLIQMPTGSIEELHRSIDWSAADVNQQVNQLLQKTALQRLVGYQRGGNEVLGEYNDKRDPTVVRQQFAYMLTYPRPCRTSTGFLPVPSLLSQRETRERRRHVLLGEGEVRVEATLRVVQMSTMRGTTCRPGSLCHRRKAALFEPLFRNCAGSLLCVRGSDHGKQNGFYLIMAMGSEQAGLTGAKGTIIRKTRWAGQFQIYKTR